MTILRNTLNTLKKYHLLKKTNKIENSPQEIWSKIVTSNLMTSYLLDQFVKEKPTLVASKLATACRCWKKYGYPKKKSCKIKKHLNFFSNIHRTSFKSRMKSGERQLSNIVRGP